MKKQLFILWCLIYLQSNLLTAQESKKLYNGELGIQTYTFRKVGKFSVPGTLDLIKGMGFKEIEGGFAGVDPKEYKKMCDKRGLKIVSFGAPYEDIVKDPLSIVKTAKIYKCKYVVCSWIPHTLGSFGINDAKKAVDDFNKAGKILAENGISLCYHTHGYEVAASYNGETLLDYMIKNSDPRYLNFEMDIFWIHFGGGDPSKILRKYPTRWKLMHLKDMQKGIEKNHTGNSDPNYCVELGSGELDMVEILKASQEIGIAHYFIEDESDRIFDQLPKSIKFLKESTK